MTDQNLQVDPPEIIPIAELKIGDYVTRIGNIDLRPEKKVVAVDRPMFWDGRQIGLWGVGLADGQAVTANGDGEGILVERLSAGEADRRDRMNAQMRVKLNGDGTEQAPFRFIV